MENNSDHIVIDKVKEMETNNENLALAIKALSEFYDQKTIIKNGIRAVR